jgi:hypothetical protein
MLHFWSRNGIIIPAVAALPPFSLDSKEKGTLLTCEQRILNDQSRIDVREQKSM